MRLFVSSKLNPALIHPSPTLAALLSANFEWPPINIGTGFVGAGQSFNSGIS